MQLVHSQIDTWMLCRNSPRVLHPDHNPLNPYVCCESSSRFRLRIQIACSQFHALVLSAFASLIAPFGGFFASGFKRGFKIKDFGDSIPGHGGMTDRMDCQVLTRA